MDRNEAARLLGVAVDADADAIQAAFRTRVRQGHPDRDGAADIDRIRRARDTLLAPAPQTATEITTPPPPTPPAVSPGRPGPERLLRGCLLIAAGWFVVGILALVLIITVGIVTTRGRPDPAPTQPVDRSCLFIAGDSYTAVACDAPGALRVVGRAQGVACAVGQDTLIADGTTWCLEPAAG